MLNSDILEADLASILGKDRVSSELYERRLYGHDLAPLPPEISIIFKTTPDVVVKPKTAEDVSKVVKYANKNSVPIVPRGGSSWGFGGTIPTRGGIVMELDGLMVINEIDRDAMTVTVGAGTRWSKIIETLEEEGFTLPVYPTSAPSATVGGWIATGGFGIGSVKYGHLIENVESIQVVTPTGYVNILNQTDPDFNKYFGSEGTLGIITEATLRIVKTRPIKPILTSFNEYETLITVIQQAISTNPFFVEIQDKDYLDIKRSIGMNPPQTQILCLFVYQGTDREILESEEKLIRIVDRFKGKLYSNDEADKEWEERFYYMKIKKAGPTLLAGEVIFPLDQLSMVVSETMSLKDRHGLEMGLKAFIVEKDSVLFMPMFLTDERRRWKYLSILPLINNITDLGLKAGGRPYGFGIWNSFYLQQVYGGQKVRNMKERKRRADPKNVMNPGKLYKVVTKYGIPLWGRVFKLFTWILGVLRFL